MKNIEYYYTINGKCPYLDWFNNLDNTFKVRIQKRLKKLYNEGHYGDHHTLQNSELSELRFDCGKGYRIYYYDLDDTLILFIAASDKKEQKKIIQQANIYFADYCERTNYEPNKRTS